MWGGRAGSQTAKPPGVPDWPVVLMAMAMSVGVELTQWFLLTRPSGTLRDLVCTCAGALVGVAVYRVIQRTHPRGPRAGNGPSPMAELAGRSARSINP